MMRLGYFSMTRKPVNKKGCERPTKAKMSKSQLKAMLIVFSDIKGIIHREYVPTDQTVTGKFYAGVLERFRARVLSGYDPNSPRMAGSCTMTMHWLIRRSLCMSFWRKRHSNVAAPTL